MCVRTGLISSASAVSLVPRPEDWTRLLSSSPQAPPSSPGLLGGACEQSYSSLARLPQQVYEQHAFLSVLSWAYSACVLFALLFQRRGTLSRSILRFCFRLLRCLWDLSRVASRTRLCHTNDPEASLCELPYQLLCRFTSETWLQVYFQIFCNATIVIQRLRMYLRYDVRTHTYIHTYRHRLRSTR